MIVFLTLLNLVFDGFVTRYDATVARDPESGLIVGATPRQLGPPSSSRAALFVHGFIGVQSNFNTLPDAVAAAGWYVETMRLPGHGTSPRDFERTTADELVAGVHDAVVSLKKNHATVVVIGHSMGGALVSLVAAQEPVDGLILCAPFFGLTYGGALGIKTEWLAQRVAPLVRWFPGRPGHGPVAKPEGRQHVQCYGWIPMAGALTALEVAERAADPDVLERIETQVLAIHSTGDSVTSQSATAEAVTRMTHATTQTCWLEKSDHVIFWDYDEGLVQEQVLTFMKEVDRS